MAVILCISTALSGCVIVGKINIQPIDFDESQSVYKKSVRVHTKKGEVVLFPEGAKVHSGVLVGKGMLYGLNMGAIEGVAIDSIAIKEVAFAESITQGVRPVATLFSTIALDAIIGVAVVGIAFVSIATGSSDDDGICQQ